MQRTFNDHREPQWCSMAGVFAQQDVEPRVIEAREGRMLGVVLDVYVSSDGR